MIYEFTQLVPGDAEIFRNLPKRIQLRLLKNGPQRPWHFAYLLLEKQAVMQQVDVERDLRVYGNTITGVQRDLAQACGALEAKAVFQHGAVPLTEHVFHKMGPDALLRIIAAKRSQEIGLEILLQVLNGFFLKSVQALEFERIAAYAFLNVVNLVIGKHGKARIKFRVSMVFAKGGM